VQASPVWTPPAGTLGGIVDEARARARSLMPRSAELERAAADAGATAPFAPALRRRDVAVIAEVKRRSPSKGWIREDLGAGEQARRYADGGAAAISVLTEPNHFAGSIEDLASVRAAVRLPTLRKDFHVGPIQLVESKAIGASAALLIARALEPAVLREMMRVAVELALEVLVEVRDERELALALGLGATCIGINNRDLETLEIDRGRSERLLTLVPSDVVAVVESGVEGRPEVENAARGGADAVLVGSSVSASDDPAAAVRKLTGVDRRTRAG
jgi:indole-3-glycerol phosphate synthase